MIDLFFWPTPNGYKISIALEEMGLPYTLKPVNIGRGDQFKPEFLAISPNNRMPAIVDHAPADGGKSLSVFESGAILVYLAEKTGRFLPADVRGRTLVLEWLAWQVAGVGPMFGQAGHFVNYAPEKVPYGIDRYTKEVHRLLGVLDHRLRGRDFVAGDYSIADMAIFPWVRIAKGLSVPTDEFPEVTRWRATLAARPAVARGMGVGEELKTRSIDDEARKILFGQTARR